ncbi:MAG: ParB/RepB/Spo0J family partition protein [Clostridiales Family XIII bacterium]|jgi:ParB family chromosome partitioning protein|nr:ParB/RepB/Spo0J family partition protein [Clostridiales Family XIII bacterium]
MAGKKQALGRGLGALFGEIEAPVPAKSDAKPSKKQSKNPEKALENGALSADSVFYINIDDIRPNAMQPRQSFAPEAIEELADSIQSYGVIQPIILRKSAVGYEIVAGERRWRAARKAGLREIPAIVREFGEEENALIAIIENMQREDLNTVEEATAFKTILAKYGMTQEELSKAIGKSRPHIANTLRTLRLPPEVVELLRTGRLSLGHANALGAIKDRDKLSRLAEKIAKDGLSVRETERLAQDADQAAPKRTKRKGAAKTNEIRLVEQELTSLIGARVVINGDREGGSVELKYHDRAGLDDIVEYLRSAGKNR